MDIKTVEYKNIDETMHIYEHRSGLKCFVIPKRGYSKKFATFATHYGSINNQFIVPGESEITTVPDGIAHFLEHKLFEQKDGSVMDKFSQLGSNPNAYTSFAQTAYLFSCTDKFDENFRLLLNYVQNPYITEESVEKEKDIIGQEIRMYEDNPNWRVFFNLLRGFYVNNPIKIDIAGSIESISKINKDILYTCYNTFYHPSNMIIVVVGDVDAPKVFEQVEKSISVSASKPEIKRIFPDEPDKINESYVEQKLAVAMPLFQMGYKDSGFCSKGMDCLMRETAVKILLEMIMGRSSKLYNDLYNEGLINNTFEFDYTIEENYAYSAFGGESKDPLKVKEKVLEEITSLQQSGLNMETYERIRRAQKGRFVKQFNSVERIAHNFVSVYFKEVNIFDYMEVYDKITFEYVNKVFREHFAAERLAISVIKPA
ncbi:EF-P 5-aminopentanol modification-associated protein YfmH [Acetivibrio clariflavus]|uniref:Putative Zn-dependent peptidase n=1 Tax=Acetivibrio clariflavus (strain DSM 19732 / NBRC 101661 / EBR45) TaxID=720554 RepID=G8LZ63_ACECE|nr:pitrilysin family protein [Acetivibrio clariflavus]AEV69007.1 putative Zn-dependent peptidase [Acetivibrio clariflavus DSM 19732]